MLPTTGSTIPAAIRSPCAPNAIAEVAAAFGHAPTPKEMGAVMKAVQARLQAASLRAEGRTVSDLVKKALAG